MRGKAPIAHLNERNSPLRGGVSITSPACAPSPQAALFPASLCCHHFPTPRRLCQRQTGPIFISAQARRFPHRAGKGQPLLAWFLALPQGSERPIRDKPLCTPSVSAGVTRVSADAPDVIVLPLLAVTRPGVAGSVRPRCSFALAFCGGGCVLI